MRHHELRDVLLIRAIEEVDREGTLIPPADRASAARDARRSGGQVEGMVVARARTLVARVVARHPFVENLRAMATGGGTLGGVLLLVALLVGFGMSALEGSRRINILVPAGVLAIVAWNFVVYIFLALKLARPRGANLLSLGLGKLAFRRLSARIAQSASFNAPLAEGLSRFARTWFDAARPWLTSRATTAFHLSAAAMGLGLMAGLYLRGVVFDYQAGWESTFLDATAARQVLAVAYGPASMITGIGIPEAPQLEAIRWANGRGGTNAAPWLHLLAATLALCVIVPRVLLAIAAWFRAERLARNLPLPVMLPRYFETVFGGEAGFSGRGAVAVVPYAYEPAAASRSGLRTHLARLLGDGLTIDARAPVRYGEEDAFMRGLDSGEAVDVVVLLFNLASTPEVENHGALIAGLRDWASRAASPLRVVVIVDEAAYAARMGAQAGARLDERRESWKEFVGTHGMDATFVNLAAGEREA